MPFSQTWEPTGWKVCVCVCMCVWVQSSKGRLSKTVMWSNVVMWLKMVVFLQGWRRDRLPKLEVKLPSHAKEGYVVDLILQWPIETHGASEQHSILRKGRLLWMQSPLCLQCFTQLLPFAKSICAPELLLFDAWHAIKTNSNCNL